MNKEWRKLWCILFHNNFEFTEKEDILKCSKCESTYKINTGTI